MSELKPEIEWVNGSGFGVIQVLGTGEWVVVRKQITIFGWSDPRLIYSRKGDFGTEQILTVTVAPDKKAAIGYCKLLQEDT